MAEKFYIADEALGGIEREYVGSEGKKAEIGDKVINTVDGEISVVSRLDDRDDNYIEITDEDRSYFGGLFDGEYYVIEPVDSEEPPKPIPPEADSVTEMLANLAQEVVKLRKQVAALSEQTDSNGRDIVSFAEELMEFKAEQSGVTDMILDDIVLLDERTQPEELAETVLGNITIRRSMYGDY